MVVLELCPRNRRLVADDFDAHDFRQDKIPRDADGGGVDRARDGPCALDFPCRRSMPRNVQGDLSMDDFRDAVPLLRDRVLRTLPSLVPSRKRSLARGLFAVLIAGAWGAEITFLHVQHSIIKNWCSICLAVALCVCVVGMALGTGYFSDIRKQYGSGREAAMRYLSRGVFLTAGMTAGSYVAFLGVGNTA